MRKHERFSLRKYKVGVVSVVIGAFFLSGAQQVQADVTSAAPAIVTQAGNQTDQAASEVEVSAGLAATPEVSSPEAVVAPEAAPVEATAAEAAPATDPLAGLPVVTEKSAQPAPTAAPVVATPQNNDSNTIVTVPETWESGYKGEGMIVAVIDSGLDVEHDAMRLTDVSKAKYQSEDQMKAALAEAGITYGQWYSDKVVFGYNYVDVNTDLKEAATSSHGMHVTGIATGNPSQPVGDELIMGVAPEAQVMFMRVFSDVHSTTGQALYVQAIKDAVKLKADAINLSLGGANGSVVNVGEDLIAAIEMARKAGVSVVMAGGNDGTFGSGHSNPLVTNPDYGLVGSPSTARDAISVASFNNTTIMSEVVQIVGLEGNAELNNGKSSFTNPDLSKNKFEPNTEYELVYAGLGRPEDFDGIDVTGKVALVQRGELFFSEKIANATARGAIGVVVFNHTAGAANINMSLDDTAKEIPSIFIPYEFGNALKENPALKLSFKGEKDKSAHPAAGKLSDFSSWGLSADGELKPDLAAPGGGIYASINDNKYDSMNGTSMASPHVAGAAVLVKQYLKEAYPGKSAEEYEALVKYLMMSTARLHVNTEMGAYTSPRQQGAGVLDTKAAISTGLYLTGAENYGSISLGNVDEAFSFEVTVHNITKEDKTLKYVTHVNTDFFENGFMALKPIELGKFDGEVITVPAGGSKTVTVTVDTSEFTADATAAMPNGYYLEGFVRFVDPTDEADVVSIPYVGFKGDFANLAVLEEPVYKLLADGKGGVYFTPEAGQAIPGKENFTGLVTESSDVVYSNNNARTGFELKTLGTFKNDAGAFVLEVDETGVPRFAISPNGDGNQDSLALRGVFLRSYNNLVAAVYKADDTEMSTPLWASKPTGGGKNFFSGNPRNEKSSVIFPTEFLGRDKDGNALEDGSYKYVLTYYPDVVGADKQTMTFDLLIDRQAPKITTATYDEATFVFDPRPAVEDGPSGLLRERVFYLVRDADGDASKVEKDADSGKLSIVDNRVYIAQNEDGSFTLPLDLAELKEFYYTVEDFAGNLTSAKVADLVTIGNDTGLVEVRVVDSETGEPTSVTHSFSIKDADGNMVMEVPRYAETKNVLKLPFGTYTIDLFIHDAERSVVDGETSFTVDLTEDNSRQTVDFLLKLLAKQVTVVAFDQTLPAGSTVALENASGAQISLPVARYNKQVYGKDVPVGDYTLAVQLPAGYEILEDLAVVVGEDGQSLTRFTLINKTDLILASKEEVKSEPKYYNATPDLKTAYDKALATAVEVIANKNDQTTVDAATDALTKAIEALDGKPTDKSALEAAIAKEVFTTSAYYNGTEASKLAYEAALAAARKVFDTARDQVDVDAATTALTKAIDALDGKPTDKSELKKAIDTDVLATPAYYNGSRASQATYAKALEVANRVFDSAREQATVDKALAVLKVAITSLDGKETDKSALEATIADDATVTPAYYNGSASAKEAYDQALAAAQEAHKTAREQATVDKALADLRVAINSLDGQPTDKSVLEATIADDVTVTPAYYNGSASAKEAYDQALAAAQEAIKTALDQASVDAATKALKAAITALDGKPTDKTALVAASQEDVTNSPAYYNGSEAAKTAYAEALAAAQEAIETALDQASVDAATKALKAAIAALDGKETDKTALTQLVVASQALVATNADRYRYAAQSDKVDFEAKLAQALALLTTADASQAEVDAALTLLSAAKDQLKGQAPAIGDSTPPKGDSDGKDQGAKTPQPDPDKDTKSDANPDKDKAPTPEPKEDKSDGEVNKPGVPIASSTPSQQTKPKAPVSSSRPAGLPQAPSAAAQPVASAIKPSAGKTLPQTNAKEKFGFLRLGYSLLGLVTVVYYYNRRKQH